MTSSDTMPSTLPTGSRGQLLALLLLLVASAGLYLPVALPLFDLYGQRVAQLTDMRMLLPRLDTLVATAPARPLYNATRRPPPADGDDKAVDNDLTNMRLTGIVTEPGGRFAIFAVTDGKPLAIREGEAVSDWRIQSIEPDEVPLTGPGGTKTLHTKPDTSLTRPSPRLRSRRRMAERPAHPAGAADLLRRRAMRRAGAGPRR